MKVRLYKSVLSRTEEAAVVLGVSYDQARRDWTVARVWFRTEMRLPE